MTAPDYGLMLLVALVWSGGWIAGKVGVTAIPPLALSAVRFLIAGALMLGLARATRSAVPWSRWPALLALAASGIVGYNAFVFVGLVMAPASDGGLIVPTFQPVASVLLAAAFVGEPLTRQRVAGLLASIVGVALIVLGAGGLAPGSERRLLGDLLILAGAVCWSIYTVIGKSLLRDGSPLGVVAASSLIGGLLLVPLAVVEGGLAGVAAWPAQAWLSIGYLVVFATLVGFVLYYELVRRRGAGRASMTTYFVPVLTLVLAGTLLAERVEPLQVAGGALAILGVRVASVPEGDEAWLRRFAGI